MQKVIHVLFFWNRLLRINGSVHSQLIFHIIFVLYFRYDGQTYIVIICNFRCTVIPMLYSKIRFRSHGILDVQTTHDWQKHWEMYLLMPFTTYFVRYLCILYRTLYFCVCVSLSVCCCIHRSHWAPAMRSHEQTLQFGVSFTLLHQESCSRWPRRYYYLYKKSIKPCL